MVSSTVLIVRVLQSTVRYNGSQKMVRRNWDRIQVRCRVSDSVSYTSITSLVSTNPFHTYDSEAVVKVRKIVSKTGPAQNSDINCVCDISVTCEGIQLFQTALLHCDTYTSPLIYCDTHIQTFVTHTSHTSHMWDYVLDRQPFVTRRTVVELCVGNGQKL